MPADTEDEFGIVPYRVYRKSHRITREIIGLKPTAIDEAIADGTLPLPMPLTKYGKALGWMGWQLIEVQRKRLAAAAPHAAQRAARRPAHKKKSKSRGAGR